MVKLLKEWVAPCNWNGWLCKNCKNKTTTNRIYVDGLKIMFSSVGNDKNCISRECKEVEPEDNVSEMLKDSL